MPPQYSHSCTLSVFRLRVCIIPPLSEAQKTKSVQKWQTRVMGGDWTLVNKRTMEILGESARSRISRWIRGARRSRPDLLVDLQATPTLNDGIVFANPYLVGDKEKERLDLESARKALEIAVAATQDGRPLSAPAFLKDVCAPLLAIQTWKAALFKKYGQLAENPATQRVIQFLQTSRGRKQVCIFLRRVCKHHSATKQALKVKRHYAEGTFN